MWCTLTSVLALAMWNDTLDMDIACGIGVFLSSQDNIMHI